MNLHRFMVGWPISGDETLLKNHYGAAFSVMLVQVDNKFLSHILLYHHPGVCLKSITGRKDYCYQDSLCSCVTMEDLG
jgi:hypothetical protein